MNCRPQNVRPHHRQRKATQLTLRSQPITQVIPSRSSSTQRPFRFASGWRPPYPGEEESPRGPKTWRRSQGGAVRASDVRFPDLPGAGVGSAGTRTAGARGGGLHHSAGVRRQPKPPGPAPEAGDRAGAEPASVPAPQTVPGASPEPVPSEGQPPAVVPGSGVEQGPVLPVPPRDDEKYRYIRRGAWILTLARRPASRCSCSARRG